MTQVVTRGMRREVEGGGMEFPAMVESFTMPEAAVALGKSLPTLRRWIADDIIPAPYLTECSTGYKVYSRGELDIIVRALREHSNEFTYVSARNEHTRHAIHQQMQAYRAMSI